MQVTRVSYSVEAFQWTGSGPSPLPTWLMVRGIDVPTMNATNLLPLRLGKDRVDFAQPGDWIVQMPNGKLKLLTDAEFKMKFTAPATPVAAPTPAPSPAPAATAVALIGPLTPIDHATDMTGQSWTMFRKPNRSQIYITPDADWPALAAKYGT